MDAPFYAGRVNVPSDAAMEWHGTGVIFRQSHGDGFVLTNHHVVAHRLEDVGHFILGNGDKYEFMVIDTEPELDLALLCIRDYHGKAIKMAAAPPEPGSVGYFGGFGGGNKTDGWRWKCGYVKGCSRCLNSVNRDPFLLGVAGEVRKGDSGGPMTNRAGELVGILRGNYEGSVWGTHITYIRKWLALVM